MRKRLLFIIIAFSVSFISMVALSLFSMERFTTFTNYSDLVDNTNVVISQLYKMELHIRDVDRAERGYMITRDTMYLRFLNNAVDSIYTSISELGKVTADNPKQQNNISLLKSSAALRISAARQNIDYVDTAKTDSLSKYYYESRQLMLECSHTLKRIHDEENRLLAERFKRERFYERLTTDTLEYLLFVFCVITLVLFFIMIKEFKSRIRYQDELQAKIIDLKRSHSELQEIAYAASHDLQEPLRKIQVFSDMLLYRKTENPVPIGAENKLILERINNSAGRMQLLIADLMALTNLANTDEYKTAIDLNRMLPYIISDFDDKIKEKTASVQVQELPVIKGYDHQLKILFGAVLDNSLKFTRNGVHPVITICCDEMNGHELSGINPNLLHKKFYRITCSDNGIGFDNQYITKIFRIFQRLHTEESAYEGKGIGLAICQRIMANHEGYIMAHGETGIGAQFKLFFPVEE
jgi:signal transduction histidine kinase